jgi:2-dehydropantoate 2-reductase
MTAAAVIGAGAIGGTVAVRLIESRRHVVTVCARSPTTELAVEAFQGVSTVIPVTLTSPDEAAPVDWVCIATKTYDSAGTASWLRALVGPLTRVAVLQNGVEHVPRFAPYVPVAQLVPVVVDMERVAPGRFRQRRDGRLTVAAGDDGRSFTGLFAGTPITVTMTQDFRTEAWRKLGLNCAGVVSA